MWYNYINYIQYGVEQKVNRESVLMEIINILAVIIAPVIAVVVGQHLQDRAEKRRDKMQIFKTLMTSRIYGWTPEGVHALNLIDVVFVKDIPVRAAWKSLLEAYSSTEKSDLMKKKREDLMCALLEKMAISVGYKDKITWETIRNPYIPQGMVDQIISQSQSQHDYLELLKNVSAATSFNKNSEDNDNEH